MTQHEPGAGQVEARRAPVGVRPAPGAPGHETRRLRWVMPGSFAVAPGDRVAVREGDAEWLGEVMVPPERLVEWPALGRLPEIARRATDAEWPSAPATDGRRLLASLGLPSGLLARGPSSARGGRAAGSSGGAGESAQHE